MRKLILFIVMSISFLSSSMAQSDTTYIQQTSDTTFQQVTINYDDQGREIMRQNTYFDSVGFFSYIFDLTVKSDKQHAKSELKNIELDKVEKVKKKAFKEMKAFYNAFTGQDYETVLDSILKSQLDGDWRLKVDGEEFEVKLTNNQKKIKDNNSNKKMKIFYIQFSKIEIKQSVDVPFFIGDVILLESRDGQGRRMYRGKTDTGIKVVLRR